MHTGHQVWKPLGMDAILRRAGLSARACAKIRKATVPEAIHREIYTTLRIPVQVITPVKTWHRQGDLVTTRTLTY